MSTIRLVAPNGRVYEVPEAEAPEAMALHGFRAQTAEEIRAFAMAKAHEDLGSELASGTLGALSGLTLGLSDVALTRSGAISPEALSASKQASPSAYGAGQITGAIGGTLALGALAPAGAAATAGARAGTLAARGLAGVAGKGIAGKLVQKGVAGAVSTGVEGTLFGAGQAISEDALGEVDLTAESLLAKTGMGALFGVGVGGVLGMGPSIAKAGISALAKKATEKASTKTVSEFLEDFAKRRAIKTAVGHQKSAFKKLETQGLTDEAGDYLLREIGLAKNDTTEKMAEALTVRMQTIGEQLGDVVKIADNVSAGRGSLRPNPRQVASRLKKIIDTEYAPNPALRDIKRKLENEYDTLRSMGSKPITFEQARKIRGSYQDKINYARNNGLNTEMEAFNKIPRLWNDVIDEKIEPLLNSAGVPQSVAGTYREIRREYRIVAELAKASNDRALGNAANRFISPSDYGVGGAVGLGSLLTEGGLSSTAKGAAASIAHKIVREHAGAWFGEAAYRASRLNMLRQSTEEVLNSINEAAASFVSKTTKAEPIARSAAIRISGQKSTGDIRKDFEEDSGAVINLSGSTGGLTQKLGEATEKIGDIAPKTTMMTISTAAKGISLLRGKMPLSQYPGIGLGIKAKPRLPSDSEISKWYRYHDTVVNPLRVLTRMKDGRITPEEMEAMQVVYPRLYGIIRQSVAEKVAASKNGVPYEKRLALSHLFGVPFDATMRPDFVAAIQQTYIPAEEQEKPSRPETQSEYASSYQTRSQRIRSNNG